MGIKRSYKQYPKVFKEEAVALVLDQGYSVPEAAKSLGIATNMLYRWKQQFEKQEQDQFEEQEQDQLNNCPRKTLKFKTPKQAIGIKGNVTR